MTGKRIGHPQWAALSDSGLRMTNSSAAGGPGHIGLPAGPDPRHFGCHVHKRLVRLPPSARPAVIVLHGGGASLTIGVIPSTQRACLYC